MITIGIRHKENSDSPFRAALSFDGEGEYPIEIADPFAPEEEQELEWYFEEYLMQPHAEVRAKQAAESVRRYGVRLFEQVFADRQAFARYSAALQEGTQTLRFEIAGPPGFHVLH